MFGPGMPLYLTYFYSKQKVGFRHGIFISGAAAANAYGSALAYGISQIKGSLAPWKILFIIGMTFSRQQLLHPAYQTQRVFQRVFVPSSRGTSSRTLSTIVGS